MAAKKRAATTTHKKVVIVMLDGSREQGYLNASDLGQKDSVEILTNDGENRTVELAKIKSIHFVREFREDFDAARKAFLSRPKLDGLWVRLRFRDDDVLEGIVANDLLDLLVNGVRLTPPDLHGNSLWIFIPRTALAEMKVLGVVGVARRQPAAAADIQPKLFSE
ncbi:MAG TPA: hypothetical protein VJN90_03940 [Candidatus Acidoferrales bacterium]|nr:hypothetical protein [Candidatus Acidoferrales bacterium]